MRRLHRNCVLGPDEIMIEILKSFEQEAGRFDPAVLVMPGLALVVLGLVVWLAGMCLRRMVLALVGVAVGAIAGWLFNGPNPVLVGVAAGCGAVFSALVPRLSTALVLAAFGVAVAFVVTTQTHFAQGTVTPFVRPDAGRGQEKLSIQDSLGAVRVLAANVIGCVKSIARDVEPVSWAIIGAIGVGLLVLGLLLVRLAGALVFSTLGTAVIFAGLIVLLIFKGSAPITFVQKQATFYGLVLLGMAAFGTLEQLVLCPSPRRGRKGGSAGLHPRVEESERNWRGR
jgi:hypothetical protein